MTGGNAAAAAGAPAAASASTRMLLSCAVVAGPLYIVLVLLQMLIRDGFDISRHPASLLSNGDLGWIQIVNFALSGLLFVAGAVGLYRVLVPVAGRRGAWGAWLIGVFGAGMVAASVFSADPVDGFPPGTPLGPPTTISTQGFVHFLVGMIGFLALMAACFVLGRWFAAIGRRGWATFSTVTGAVFLLSWLSLFALQGVAVANIALALAIGLAMTWASSLAAHLLNRVAEHGGTS